MRERKYVKLKVNMYDDTKFKIIDMKPERDLIHYVWTRFIALAGMVNLEGDLYMSKTIPYTMETLAIAFNRDINQIKLALDVFVELEMIEITEHNVYRVKNFAKHQNIKVKDTVKVKGIQEEPKIKAKIEEVKIEENIKNKKLDNESEETENQKGENEVVKVIANEGHNLGIDNTICGEKIDDKFKTNLPIVLEEKKNNKEGKSKNQNKNNKNSNNINEIDMDDGNEEDSLMQFYEGEVGRPLQEGESVVLAWSF